MLFLIPLFIDIKGNYYWSRNFGVGGGGRYFRDLVTAVKFRVPTFGGSSELYGLNKALYLHDRGYVLRLG